METAFGVLIAVVAFAAFPWVGWRSLRRLRDTPQFPHREEMLWGAKYGGWVASLGLWVPFYGFSLWFHYVGRMPFTVLGMAFIVISVFGLVSMSVLYWQMAGTFYALTEGVRRLKQQPADREAVLEHLRRGTDSRTAKVLRGLLVVSILFWLGFIATFGLPVDRAMAAEKWQNKLEAEISAEAAGLPVEDLFVTRAWGEFTPGYPGVDDWTPLLFPIEGSPFHTGLSEVSISMEDDAQASDARRAAEVAERVLSRRGLEDEWIITVHHPPAEPLERRWPMTGS